MSEEITFSFDQLLGLAAEGYNLEVNMLANVVASRYFAPLLPRFGNYPAFLREDRSIIYDDEMERLYTGDSLSRTIDASEPADVLSELLACAHLAASCYLFAGETFTPIQLNHQGLNSKVTALFKQILDDSPRNIRRLLHNLHNVDAIRTVHIVKLAGVLDLHYDNCRQLSLGAGHGSRDLASIHQVPVISEGSKKLSGSGDSTRTLNFNSYCRTPRDVILSDNDPGLRDYLDEFNRKPDSGIKAIPEDTYEALEKAPALMAKHNLALRNLVVLFRIDHRMLPDLPQFFRLLSAVISDGADFILSIGAGHDLDEFTGRLDKIREISDFLNSRGIQTTRFRLYRGGNPEERRNHRAFGALSFATYEILHCKLNRDNLSV